MRRVLDSGKRGVGRVGDRVLTTQRVNVIYHATLIEIAQH